MPGKGASAASAASPSVFEPRLTSKKAAAAAAAAAPARGVKRRAAAVDPEDFDELDEGATTHYAVR